MPAAARPASAAATGTPAAQAPQWVVVAQAAAQVTGGGDVQHRLGNEGAGQRRAVVLRAPAPAPCGREDSFHADEVEHGDEKLVAFVRGAEVLLNLGEGTERLERHTSMMIGLHAGTRPLVLLWLRFGNPILQESGLACPASETRGLG